LTGGLIPPEKPDAEAWLGKIERRVSLLLADLPKEHAEDGEIILRREVRLVLVEGRDQGQGFVDFAVLTRTDLSRKQTPIFAIEVKAENEKEMARRDWVSVVLRQVGFYRDVLAGVPVLLAIAREDVPRQSVALLQRHGVSVWDLLRDTISVAAPDGPCHRCEERTAWKQQEEKQQQTWLVADREQEVSARVLLDSLSPSERAMVFSGHAPRSVFGPFASFKDAMRADGIHNLAQSYFLTFAKFAPQLRALAVEYGYEVPPFVWSELTRWELDFIAKCDALKPVSGVCFGHRLLGRLAA